MKHTKRAMEAARVIMNGRKRVSTEYGAKHLEGIADLIDMATGDVELLEACRDVVKGWETGGGLGAAVRRCAAAIKQAEEGD